VRASTTYYAVQYELHGSVMDRATHYWIHETIGCRYGYGLTATFNSTSMSISSGTFHDEDIRHNITGSDNYPSVMIYRDTDLDWVFDNTAPTLWYEQDGSGNPYYDDSGTLTACPNAKYTIWWIFGISGKTNKIGVFMGQEWYNSLSDAQNANISDMIFGTFPIIETKVLYKVILQNGGTNTVVDTQDFRSVSQIPGATPTLTSHSNLSDLGVDDHPQYILADGSRPMTATWNIGQAIEGVDSLQFDTINVCTDHAPGKLHWNLDDATLELGLLGSNVHLQIGQEQLSYCYNGTGNPIYNGTAVSGIDINGTSISIAKTDATNHISATAFLGVTTEDIADGSYGYVTIFGYIRNINTSTLTSGHFVYVDPSVPGGLTTTRPLAPNYVIGIGLVITSDVVEGVIGIKERNLPVLESLSNIYTNTGKTGMEVPIWDGSKYDIRRLVQADIDGLTTADSPTFTNLTLSGGDITGSNGYVLDLGEYHSDRAWFSGDIQIDGSNIIKGGDLNINLYDVAQNKTLYILNTDATYKANLNVENDLTVQNDLVVTGNLTVNGTTTTLDTQTVQATDNEIVINYGETGAGVTLGYGGLRVDRGTATDYLFQFNEASDDFRIGEDGSLQAVATREDTPNDNGVAFWDSATFKFETSAGLIFDGSGLSITKTGSGAYLKLERDDGSPSILTLTNASDKIIFNYTSGFAGYLFQLDTVDIFSVSSTSLTMADGKSIIFDDAGANDTSLSANANGLRITTPSGYGEFGARNTSWFHMYTDRSQGFYFYQPITLSNNMGITMSGTSTFTTGTGAVSINGNLTMSANKNIALSGTGTVAGILHSNILDKSAAESISGLWDHTCGNLKITNAVGPTQFYMNNSVRDWKIIGDNDPDFIGLYDTTHSSYVWYAYGNNGNFEINRTTLINEDLTMAINKNIALSGTGTIAGILFSNLVDKSAAESISGVWTFNSKLADESISSAATWNAKQNALTFGIANTNTVKIDSADIANGEYARFTASGLESRTIGEIKSDLSLVKADVGLGDVENTKLSTWVGSGNITTVGALTSGSLAAGFTAIADARIASAATWNAKVSGAEAQTYIQNNGLVMANNINIALGGTGSIETPILTINTIPVNRLCIPLYPNFRAGGDWALTSTDEYIGCYGDYATGDGTCWFYLPMGGVNFTKVSVGYYISYKQDGGSPNYEGHLTIYLEYIDSGGTWTIVDSEHQQTPMSLGGSTETKTGIMTLNNTTIASTGNRHFRLRIYAQWDNGTNEVGTGRIYGVMIE